ncbi:cobalamin-dependent protein [Saccharothrix violaceirubra]|uniref:Methanogenic corrinoid protein MtbC1 n=1 Tax=Saccharothrix violaceirubra TaxID=413306 RepID=A0A7W7WX07_9PSEU|nr:cobalamin-dependent protein [Saccharothrix violaceirubra]MBB4966631.1 methanogenic corrinoid protein MtbC1 [Saccharothrix violaceirubra]
MTDRDELLDALSAADEDAAVALAERLLDAGVPAENVLIDLVADVQTEVGRLWQTNRWTVAQEHAATAISERVIAVVARRMRVDPTRGHVVVACLDGEWHAVPPRIVAEVLRGRGWRVTFLGASVPTAHLVSYLHEHGPDAVALSCTLSRSLPRADQMITACRATGTPVLVGGRGFGAGGRWARLLGVDAWAPSATAAAELLESPRWQRIAPPLTPRRADPEYAALRTRRAELISAALAALRDAFPPMRTYDERQADATLEDLGHIVDFLGASVYVDDPGVFGEFIAWTGEVLGARGVPVASTAIAMAAMARVLDDHPRALRHLEHGRDVVQAA